MARYLEESVWDSQDGIIVLPAQATIRQDGALVIVKGSLLEAVERVGPELEYGLGRRIREVPEGVLGRLYGLLAPELYAMRGGASRYIALIQTAYNWWEELDPLVLKRGLGQLRSVALGTHEQVRLYHPGLERSPDKNEPVVNPLLMDLPDNVIVHRYVRRANVPSKR
jgi:hypothetical protein